MSVIHDFAEYFKSRKVPIRRWYKDDVGRYAFRVKIGDTNYVCAVLMSKIAADKGSCFTRIPRIAESVDGYVLLRIRDDMLVFDPKTLLVRGEDSTHSDPERARRGEEWIRFNTDWGVPFDDFVDGNAAPTTLSGLDAYS